MTAKLREDAQRTAAEIEAEAVLLPDDLPRHDATDMATDLEIIDDEPAELAFPMAAAEDTPRLPGYERHAPQKRSPKTKAKSKRKTADYSRRKNRKKR